MMKESEIHHANKTSTSQIAISARNAFKSYTSEQMILNGLNLEVPASVIYGLLGPSGCGKTTLLNCIVGRSELDSGIIELSIKKLKHLGFMPQQLCLHGGLTIYENFFFHGYLFGMTDDVIEERAANLITFLQLPSKYALISELSGGEQRRVSLATAFFHEPQLLILDEPTVGLDPVLSRSIWKRLRDLSRHGITILITTHYVQEANNADVIGLLRRGVLVAEARPQELLLAYKCNSLDDVFLKLSQKQEIEVTHNYKPESSKPVVKETPFKISFEDDKKLFTYTKFKGLCYKSASLIKRDFLMILIVLILPFLNTYFFNIAIGRNPKGLKLAIVNDEVPLINCEIEPRTCFINENETTRLSCLLLNFIKEKHYTLVEYKNNSLALAAVRKNRAWALMHFAENFTMSLGHRISDGIDVDPMHLMNSSIDTWIDSTNRYIGSFIMYDIVRATTLFLEEIMRDCNLNPKIGAAPIIFEEPVFGEYDVNFITYSAGAMICIYCFILPSVWSGWQMYVEKTDGILERTLVTGTTMLDITVAIFIFQIFIHILQTLMSMFVMYIIFDNPLRGSFLVFSVLLMFTGTAGIFFGIALGILTDNIIVLGGTSSSAVIMFSLTTGLVWPVEGAHVIMKLIRWFYPIAWTVDATRGICIKEYTFMNPVVLKGFASIIFMNVSLAACIYVLPRIKDRVLAYFRKYY